MKFNIKILGLLFSAVLVVSGCGSAPSKRSMERMSEKKLCAAATVRGKWDLSSKYKPYVKIAKARGLTCGVNVSLGSCPADLSSCSKNIICTGARTKPHNTNNASYWNNSTAFKKYVVEARSRGLTCVDY